MIGLMGNQEWYNEISEPIPGRMSVGELAETAIPGDIAAELTASVQVAAVDLATDGELTPTRFVVGEDGCVIQPLPAMHLNEHSKFRIAEGKRGTVDRAGRELGQFCDAVGVDMPAQGVVERWTNFATEFTGVVQSYMTELVGTVNSTLLQFARFTAAMDRTPRDRHHPMPIPRGRGAEYARRRRHR